MSSTDIKKYYSVDFEDRGRYIRALVEGTKSTLDITTAYWMEIAERVLSSGQKRLLVIEDIAETMTIAEVHQLVTGLADLPAKDVRVAFVDMHVEHASLNDFGILVGENRGFTLKAFDTEEAAETWLLNE